MESVSLSSCVEVAFAYQQRHLAFIFFLLHAPEKPKNLFLYDYDNCLLEHMELAEWMVHWAP